LIVKTRGAGALARATGQLQIIIDSTELFCQKKTNMRPIAIIRNCQKL
jgi:hypothetical protein